MSDTLAAPYVVLPPTQAELPYDDSIPMETQQHKVIRTSTGALAG